MTNIIMKRMRLLLFSAMIAGGLYVVELPVLAQEANVEEAAVESGSFGENLTWKVEGGFKRSAAAGGWRIILLGKMIVMRARGVI